MVDAMLLGGLRRCEVLGLRFEDVNAGERRVFIADAKGGRQRVVAGLVAGSSTRWRPACATSGPPRLTPI